MNARWLAYSVVEHQDDVEVFIFHELRQGNKRMGWSKEAVRYVW